MARALNDIYNGLITEKETQPTLTGLNPTAGENAVNFMANLSTTSYVGIWRLLFWVVAVSQWIHEQIFDQHVTEVTNISNVTITGPAPWYQRMCFLFQYGDALTYFNDHYVYNPVTPANQIIKRAAVINGQGLLKIKVAALDGGGNPIPLTGPQLTAFTYYMNLIKFAGTNMQVISLAADNLQLYYTVIYDPLVLDNTGQLISTPGTYPVEDAINAVLAALPFNGIITPTALTTAIEAATGVVEPVYTSGNAKEVGNPYAPIDQINGYNPGSGYAVIDPASTLRTTITYQAQTI